MASENQKCNKSLKLLYRSFLCVVKCVHKYKHQCLLKNRDFKNNELMSVKLNVSHHYKLNTYMYKLCKDLVKVFEPMEQYFKESKKK